MTKGRVLHENDGENGILGWKVGCGGHDIMMARTLREKVERRDVWLIEGVFGREPKFGYGRSCCRRNNSVRTESTTSGAIVPHKEPTKGTIRLGGDYLLLHDAK